jgi:PAS domain S-box-containing protein
MPSSIFCSSTRELIDVKEHRWEMSTDKAGSSRTTNLPATLARYLIAVLAMGVIIGFVFLADRVLDLTIPNAGVLYLLVVIAIVLWIGTGPGVLAVGLSMVAIASFYGPVDPDVATFMSRLVTIFIALVGGVVLARLLRQSREQLQIKNEVLRAQREELHVQNEELRTTSHALAEAYQARDQLAAIVESSEDAIIGKDLNGTIVSWNDGAKRLYGYAAEEAIGQSISILSPPDHQDDIPAVLSRIRQGDPIEAYETVRMGKDDKIVEVSLTVSPVKDANGAIVRASTIARDITTQKRAEREVYKLHVDLERRAAELAATNGELEAFSYSVSHDLRAPLRGIDGFSQALLEDYHDKLDAQGKNYLRRVRAASQRMAQLIDDLLNLSRITRSEMRHEAMDMSNMAAEIAAELQCAEPDRQVEIVIAPNVSATGDSRLLRMALGNLLNNAWKFTGKHATSRIEFGVVQQDENPVYYVRDDGAGFDTAYAGKLFGAFQRLHGMAEFPGTGIGLATVQRIVHRHGGRVWAESAVEQGATFYFTLS